MSIKSINHTITRRENERKKRSSRDLLQRSKTAQHTDSNTTDLHLPITLSLSWRSRALLTIFGWFRLIGEKEIEDPSLLSSPVPPPLQAAQRDNEAGRPPRYHGARAERPRERNVIKTLRAISKCFPTVCGRRVVVLWERHTYIHQLILWVWIDLSRRVKTHEKQHNLPAARMFKMVSLLTPNAASVHLLALRSRNNHFMSGQAYYPPCLTST